MKIYTCDAWGARPPRHGFPFTAPTCSVVHHMDNANRPLVADHTAAVRKAFQIARECQDFHMNGNGWADSGQHFTVTREGIVLEARHGSLDALLSSHCVRGAHAADPDTGADANDSWGTEHEGTYITEAMPKAQWDAAVALQAFICFHSKLDTASIEGHRDSGCRTECPGDWFEEQLPRLRKEAHAMKLMLMRGSDTQ